MKQVAQFTELTLDNQLLYFKLKTISEIFTLENENHSEQTKTKKSLQLNQTEVPNCYVIPSG